MRSLQPATLMIASLAVTAPSMAKTFVFPNFKNTHRLTLIGDAAAIHTRDGHVLRLVPAQGSQVGAAIGKERVKFGPNGAFTATFSFRITDFGADGFTLLLARRRTKIGLAGGGGLGYSGVPDSVAVTFDTYQNSYDPGNNQVTVERDGDVFVHDSGAYGFPYGVSFCSAAGQPGCLANGDIWTAKVSYDGQAMTVTVQDGANAPSTVVDQYPVDLVGTAHSQDLFVGMSAGTGAIVENIDVLNFTLDTGAGAP